MPVDAKAGELDMILLVLLLLDGSYSYRYARVSRQLFDNTIELLAPIL